MRKWIKQRRQLEDPSLLQHEIRRHQETRAQLLRLEHHEQRLVAQLDASRKQVKDLTSQIEYLHRVKEYEKRCAEQKLSKLAAEVHASRHPVSSFRTIQRISKLMTQALERAALIARIRARAQRHTG